MCAQPATSRLLLESLALFVKDEVKDYPFPSPQGFEKDCQVFVHGLPDEQETETYPFVIVRWLEGEIASEEDAKTVVKDTVILALGIHNPHSQAEAGTLLAELMDCLRRALWKKRILANRFELIEPLRSQIIEQQRQQHRFHLATIETVWNYTWPPKALEEAGQSQMRSAEPLGAGRPYGSGVPLAGAGFMSVESYSEPELALAWAARSLEAKPTYERGVPLAGAQSKNRGK